MRKEILFSQFLLQYLRLFMGMAYNILRIKEVAEGNLGEGVARTRYVLLYAVGRRVLQ
ncbi:MAG: hypothetical protein KAV25_03395 [Methanophagales archaeon]|nr:hypothetical protein [Methanophagales archaeon]